ncbi:MAG TPA: P1 family peptidase [Rhizobiaceae bacterium]|nr:P1 family peptidase [Rhizobiaceae bacterium]
MNRTGPRNAITDVTGILVGNAKEDALKSGVTAILAEPAATAAVHVMGGAPGTRETDLLMPENTVGEANAIVLSGGSAFGLDAASGVQARLRETGKGFAVGNQVVPIVPAAILFDLINGGNKDWGRYPPYRELGYVAVCNAASDFAIGSEGAGTGAMVAGLKGGLGTASLVLENGVTIGAIVAVNALGSPLVGDGHHFRAAQFEIGDEFGGHGVPHPWPDDARNLRIKFRSQVKPGTNTTIAAIATDAVLTKAQAKRLAIAAHDGFAHALWPSHTPLDGDLVFALATGASGVSPAMDDWIDLSAAAAAVMARAIARGIHAATPAPGDLMPTWKQKFG